MTDVNDNGEEALAIELLAPIDPFVTPDSAVIVSGYRDRRRSGIGGSRAELQLQLVISGWYGNHGVGRRVDRRLSDDRSG